MRNKLKRPRKLRFNASDFETAVKEYKENGCSREGILSLLTLAFVAVFFIFRTVRSQDELANYITFLEIENDFFTFFWRKILYQIISYLSKRCCFT